MTPQVVTETLWCLTQNPGLQQPVDEIRVITTLQGRDLIVGKLLDPKRGRFHSFCGDYGIGPGAIRFDERCIALLAAPGGETLADIRTRAHNEAAADQITAIVRELTADADTVLHASVAGGRKSMGVYLAAAMQLFGRVDDRLSHVLVSEDFESHPEFFYPPPKPRRLAIRGRDGTSRTVSTATAEIHLAWIPFIRLRGIASDWIEQAGGSYGDFVARAQEDLNLVETEQDVRLEGATNRVTVLGRAARLTPRELFFYCLYAGLRLRGRGRSGAVAISELETGDLDWAFRRLSAARGVERGIDDWQDVGPKFRFATAMREEVARRDVEALRSQFTQLRSKVARSFENAGIPERYTVVSDGDAYILRIPPNRIRI